MKPIHFKSSTLNQTGLSKIVKSHSIEQYQPDEQVLFDMLDENELHDSQFNFKFTKEIYNFLRFAGSMVWAFPVGFFMRNRIRKNQRLNYILQFKEILSARKNIEMGSFAYDAILFKESPLKLLQNKSHLANLVCLAILFGDEFIDGIAEAYGKKNIQQILNDKKVDYYLRYKKDGKLFQLYYEFDICAVLPENVLESVNSKYGISYKAFYGHLQFLLTEMNLYINRLSDEKAQEAIQLICKACNKCFDTYKADIVSFNYDYDLTELMHYQKTKDDDIVQVLLTLRAVLLNKKQLQYQIQFGSWSSMVRSMQLYDDMQDVAIDCDFQMNTLCFFAKNYFIHEWQWLQEKKANLKDLHGLSLHSSISINMPGSCILTTQYARNIAHTKLSWVQRKIQNYLWRKNWLGFNNKLLNEKGFCLSSITNKKYTNSLLKLHFIQKKVMKIENIFVTEEMKWAYIIDIAFFDEQLKKFIFKRISRKEKYFLTNCYLEFPVMQKAKLIKRILLES